jgi:hypothetical protein
MYSEKVTTAKRIAYQYFNKNKENACYRFCEEQFANDKILKTESERPLAKDRIEALLEMNPPIRKRYEIIKEKFQTEIKKTFDLRS